MDHPCWVHIRTGGWQGTCLLWECVIGSVLGLVVARCGRQGRGLVADLQWRRLGGPPLRRASTSPPENVTCGVVRDRPPSVSVKVNFDAEDDLPVLGFSVATGARLRAKKGSMAQGARYTGIEGVSPRMLWLRRSDG